MTKNKGILVTEFTKFTKPKKSNVMMMMMMTMCISIAHNAMNLKAQYAEGDILEKKITVINLERHCARLLPG